MHLTDAQLWAAALGYLSPPVIAIVQQPRFAGPLKALIMLVWALIVGLGTAYFNDQFHGQTITTCMLTAAVAIGVAYHTVWRPSGIAPGIEVGTSSGSRAVPQEPQGA
ncbi:hypothetical protein [Streptomyces lydicus]|uniref:hypothetical protein n=1 Tax=Streptomyces lydicus TaxID=47763 RepID=UPI0036E3C93C